MYPSSRQNLFLPHCMTKIFILFCLTLIAITTEAQFNDSIHHYLKYSGTGNINKTNAGQSYLISNLLRYNFRKGKKAINFSSTYVYGQQDRELSNQDFNAAMDFNVFPKDSSKLYYWGRINYDKSYSLSINGRIQGGVGVAYNFFDNDKRFLNISEGILFEKSNLKLTDSTNNVYAILRNSFRLRYRFTIAKVIVIDGANFFQNSLKDKNDYIINLSNNVSVQLRRWLNLTTQFAFNRTNNTGRENLLITFGLQAERYF